MSGRPLLSWAVATALGTATFSEVFVSTDDPEIAEIAKASGARVPSLRPTELSGDFTSTSEVMAFAVREALEAIGSFELACCIYPAAIGMNSADLTGALTALTLATRPFCASVVRYPHPVQRSFALGPHFEIEFDDAAAATQRTQDLPPRWHDAGQFYWGYTDAWLQQQPILLNAIGFEVSASRVVDIDTEDDWVRAELMHRSIAGQSTYEGVTCD